MEPNTITQGDSVELFNQLEEKSIDLVITSPPYADTLSYGKKIKCFAPENYVEWFMGIAKGVDKSLKETGSFILNINDKIIKKQRSTYVFELVLAMCQETSLKFYDTYIWSKKSSLPCGGDSRMNDAFEYIFHFVKDCDNFKNFLDPIREPHSESSIQRAKYSIAYKKTIADDGIVTRHKKDILLNPKGKKPGNVFQFNTAGASKSHGHPAAFHTEMPSFFIKWLTEANDIVLDPFMGSGTTAEACIINNRNFIGFEKNEEYIPMCNSRVSEAFAQLTLGI